MSIDEIAACFPIGSVAQLRSGGPKMTVTKVAIGSFSTIVRVRCQWFEGSSLMDRWFESELIMPISTI